MHRLDALRSDITILRKMLRGMPRSASHAQSLQTFYAAQADDYDRFRERLLPGRAELIQRLLLPANARVVELGAGTGRNLEFFGSRLNGIASFDMVDLCSALLKRARTRTTNYPQVNIIENDAETFKPQFPVDCVYFSYVLTMIPHWRGALNNALAMLKPGGTLGVVDFYISSPEPEPEFARHSALTRLFWRTWFAHDGVRLNPQHLTALCESLPEHELVENHAPVPYLPGMRVPYYLFVGRKPSSASADR